MKVAAIGLGSMGRAARALLKAGHAVLRGGPEPRRPRRLRGCGRHRRAPRGRYPRALEAVLVLTVNAAQARAALFGPEGCALRLAPGAVLLLVCATMAPADARALAADAAEQGFLYLDAPVSGGSKAAHAGTMTVMASGPEAVFTAAAPVLGAVAAQVWRLGDESGMGATMKVTHQLLAGVHIAVAAEAMALAIKAGLDPEQVYGVVTGAAGSNWMFENRMAHVLAGDETPHSAVNIFVKDLGLVEAMARVRPPCRWPRRPCNCSWPAAQGHGGKDDAFVIRAYQAMTGIKLPGEA